MTVTEYDAAYPNPAVDPKTQAVGIYMGGDTPHPWTEADIEEQTATYGVPIWVRSNPPGPGARPDAFDAIAWLKAHKVPAGCLVMLDLETAINGPYVGAFGGYLQDAGYKVCSYGSTGYLFANPPLDGYFPSVPGSMGLYDHADVIGTQTSIGPYFDMDVIASNVKLWELHPAKNPTPTPTPTPAPTPTEEDEMIVGTTVETDDSGAGKSTIDCPAGYEAGGVTVVASAGQTAHAHIGSDPADGKTDVCVTGAVGNPATIHVRVLFAKAADTTPKGS